MSGKKKSASKPKAIAATTRSPLLPPNYAALLTELKGRVRSAQSKAATAVNRELIALYLHLGRRLAEQASAAWGERVVEKLAQDLRAEFPSIDRLLAYKHVLYAAGSPCVGGRRKISPTACWTNAPGAPPGPRDQWVATPYRLLRDMRRSVILAALLAACSREPAVPSSASAPASAPAFASTPTSAPATLLSSDAVVTLDSGATFTVPAGWTLSHDGPRILLVGPEPDLRLVLVESPSTAPNDAVAAAWRDVHPDFHRSLTLAEARPARRGWDEIRSYDYESSADEKKEVFAQARRKGATWTLLLAEWSNASFDKRRAGVARVIQSLHPAGYTPESFANKTPHPLDADRAKQIVDAVDRMRAVANVPGVALALLQDGRVVYEGGLGVRELGKPDKIDAHTRFMVASLTKALTTLLMAKLVDEGKLGWDTPVASLYPGFRLGDESTTKQVLVRHLICACTGLPRHDAELFFHFDTMTPKREVDLLAELQPTTKFGETFQYSNQLAAVAGYVAGYVANPNKELGAAYEEALQKRVLDPLGMTETTFDWTRALRAPHTMPNELDVDGHPAVADIAMNGGTIPLRPSGGAWSTVHDFAKYVALELTGGRLPNGERLLSERALLERRKPQTRMSEFASYGMGLWVDHELGVDVVQHDGSQRGFHSYMFWIPSAKVGGVILVNGAGGLLGPFVRKTLEVLYDGHPEAEESVAASTASLKAEITAERARLAIPPDPKVISSLAKRYRSAALGEITVTTDAAGVTTFDVGVWKSPVATRKNDDGTLSLVMTAAGARWGAWAIEFVVGNHEGKRTLTLHYGQQDYVFTEEG